MGSKVYEASTLKAATSERAHHYEQLREQFETLKKEFSKIVENHDFKGHGADAIKGFYQGQMDVIDAWIRLIDTNVGFFKGVPGDTEDVDLSGDTFVQVPFLEDNVERAGKQAKDMVADQQEALQHIFNRVNDLVALSVFSKDAFEDQMDKAEKKRSDTVEKVNEFDQRLSEEYSISQNQEQHIYGLFAQLMEATRQGETISPLNFNAEAYQNSEVYKAIGQAKKDTSDYLTFKKQQKEDRRIAKEIEEMENRPFYEKAWDTLCTFTGEVTGYYDTQRAATGVDPVTGRKLSDAERVTSGAMAAAGFVPFVGWAGRIGKGGSAIYKTVKGANAANHMLDAHRTAQGLKNLQKAEYGIYGLVSANGFGEYFTGKDMFGNELTEQQRNQSLFNAFAIVGIGGAGYGLSKVDMGKFVQTKFPYSTQYARQKVLQAEEMAKTIKHNVGNTHIPVGFKVHALVSPTGHVIRTISTETKTVKELMQQASVTRGSGVGSSKLTGKEVKLDWLGDNYKAVEIEGSVKVNGKELDISRRVYQRTDINWDYKPKDTNAKGLTNRELIAKGRPPYVLDKNGIEAQIELHHIIQKEPGGMVEIIATTHDEYTKILHGLVENGNSFRNNPELNKQYSNFMRKYWRWRSREL